MSGDGRSLACARDRRLRAVAVRAPTFPACPARSGQVRACADALVRAAKDRGDTLVLVGQATKDGQVAGPRTLEHLVDAVLWFEGEPQGSLRILRATKNRFGAAHEVGCFAMTSEGLTKKSPTPRRSCFGRRERHGAGHRGRAVARRQPRDARRGAGARGPERRRRTAPHRGRSGRATPRICSSPFSSDAEGCDSVGTTCSPRRWAACAPSNRRSISRSRSRSLRASSMLRCRRRRSR